MLNTVFLNSERLDFDHKLDYSPLAKITHFTKYDDSTEAQILERVQDQAIIITKELPVSGDLIRQFPPTVKVICEAGTGYNNIDIAAAKERNIAVCNVPSYSTEAVAQLVITFILNLSASIKQQELMLQRKDFSNFTDRLQVPHYELQGKTLGIIGAGDIGKATIRIARAIGMNVLAYTRTAREWGDQAVRSASLEEVLQESDFVSIHCPLTPDTRHLINYDRISLMKRTAYIINTARGPVIKEADLIAALKQGLIAGAALDVQEVEPPSADNPLFAMDNVIMTPHIGWRRLESRQRLVDLTARNIEAYLQGHLINVVNK